MEFGISVVKYILESLSFCYLATEEENTIIFDIAAKTWSMFNTFELLLKKILCKQIHNIPLVAKSILL